MADILGLWGDASDNIPGVPGVGEKTAKKLMGEYDTMENLYEHLDDLKGKLLSNLKDNHEQALLSKTLATINLECPLSEQVDDLIVGEKDKQALSELFVELEFNALGKKILGTEFQSGRGHASSGQQEIDLLGTSLASFDAKKQTYTLVESLEDLMVVRDALRDSEEFCFDVETDGLDTQSCRLLGLALSNKAHEAWYCPYPTDATAQAAWKECLAPALDQSTSVKVGHNLKFDIEVLVNQGIPVSGPFFDTLLAHYLVDPDQRHKMDDLSRQYLGYEPIPITSLIGEKGDDQKTLELVPVEEVTRYAAEDADITLQLAQLFKPMLKEHGQDKVFETLEMPLLQVLVDMENAGMCLDESVLTIIGTELGDSLQSMEAKAYELAGREFNLNSPKQLGTILFDELKIIEKPKKTRTGQYSTNEQALQNLMGIHPLVDLIMEYRVASKLKSTYVDALPASVNKVTGRIHTSFSQMAAATGRLASSNPNLQNIPIRTEMGRRVRKAFVPYAKDDVILSADYSQIELRVMADLSQDPGMTEAFQAGQDIHTATAARVYGVNLEDVTSEMRRKAKMVNFGIIYGISAFGLSQRLHIPRGEASDIIKAYFAQYPAVKDFMDQTIESAREKGYVETKSGRRRTLRDINSSNHTTRTGAERMAINSPVQGTAADMIKLAMIRVDEVLKASTLKSQMLLQVHDELVFNVPKSEIEEIKPLIETCMVEALPLSVPVVVETGWGSDWLEAH